MLILFIQLNSSVVAALTLVYSSNPLSLSIYFTLFLPLSVSVRVIRHHVSGRGVVLVMLTILHESRLNLIGWISCDAVLASVQLVHLARYFISVICVCVC